MLEKQTLAGRGAPVTGSSRGTGRQIALGPAKHRCNVIIHGREIEGAGSTRALPAPMGVGTLVPALLPDFGPSGISYAAQDFAPSSE